MNSAFAILSCDLGEPMLIPAAEDFEEKSKKRDPTILEKRSTPFQDQEEEWADIT